jgi:hypothetical protein
MGLKINTLLFTVKLKLALKIKVRLVEELNDFCIIFMAKNVHSFNIRDDSYVLLFCEWTGITNLPSGCEYQ